MLSILPRHKNIRSPKRRRSRSGSRSRRSRHRRSRSRSRDRRRHSPRSRSQERRDREKERERRQKGLPPIKSETASGKSPFVFKLPALVFSCRRFKMFYNFLQNTALSRFISWVYTLAFTFLALRSGSIDTSEVDPRHDYC